MSLSCPASGSHLAWAFLYSVEARSIAAVYSAFVCGVVAPANWPKASIAVLPTSATHNLVLFILFFPFQYAIHSNHSPAGRQARSTMLRRDFRLVVLVQLF